MLGVKVNYKQTDINVKVNIRANQGDLFMVKSLLVILAIMKCNMDESL